MSAVSLGIYTIRGAQSSLDDLVAINLAQEGLEGVRWLRDSNWKNDINWDNGIIGPTVYTVGRMEVNNPQESVPFEYNILPAGETWQEYCVLCFDDQSDSYFHIDSGSSCEEEGYKDSGYSRLLVARKYSNPGSPERLMVGSIVYQGAKEYALFEEFYDWWP